METRLFRFKTTEEHFRDKLRVENWSHWRGRIRSKSRVRGFDFLMKWIPEKHPELLKD
jgi:hypothetical protein